MKSVSDSGVVEDFYGISIGTLVTGEMSVDVGGC